jgi:hypothetical protein
MEASNTIAPPGIRYYDARRHWTKKIVPHLGNKKLTEILVRDFNKFTFGRWRKPFRHGDLPCQFESCSWRLEHRRPYPRFWAYVKHAACHWLVNFNLKLVSLAEPDRLWRIITSDRHSTVWDGKRTLFDLNFLALGVSPQECFELAHRRELPLGRSLRVYFAQHYTEER